MSRHTRHLTVPTDAENAAGPAPRGTEPSAREPLDRQDITQADSAQADATSLPEPASSVSPRADAIADAGMMHVAWDSAVKQNLFASRPGYPSSAINLQTRLQVKAWVRPSTQKRSVWIDVHVLGRDGALVHAETFPLWPAQQADDGGELFAIDRMLYDGAIATRGSVTPRPDARIVQYRLYCELGGRVFTDAILHQCELRSDAASR
jgi:hypothetical protein